MFLSRLLDKVVCFLSFLSLFGSTPRSARAQQNERAVYIVSELVSVVVVDVSFFVSVALVLCLVELNIHIHGYIINIRLELTREEISK